jgi:ADP-heptose:LPS heptosyltransferase
MTRILVIKFGALGDFAQVFHAFAAIRAAHEGAQITLLTTPPYERLAAASGLFDRIETDGRPKDAAAWLRMARRLRRARYDRVYDLHTSKSSTRLWWAMLPRPPEWSGIARLGSHPQTRPDRNGMHNLDRMADQLHVAGIGPAYADGAAPPPDLSFAVQASLAKARAEGFPTVGARFGLAPPFALLVPGASASRPEKLWPTDRYAALAAALTRRGVQVAVLGGPEQGAMAAQILGAAPAAVDLTGSKTDQLDFAGLGAECLLCVGGDTGPVHMATYAGAPGVMLLSTRVSNPAHVGPRTAMRQLFAQDLDTIATSEVLSALEPLLPAVRG